MLKWWCALCPALLINLSLCADLEATDIAKRIATRAKNAIEESSWGYYKNFGTWNYQGAMMYRGLWEIQSALADQADFDIESFLHQRLNFFLVRRIYLVLSMSAVIYHHL